MQAVYERTQSNLPKEELVFANNIVRFQEYNKDSDAAYWRKPSMNLDNEIKEIVAKAGGELPGEINLYCDTLHLGPASTIDTTQDLDLTIYAREIIITPARGEALITINASNTAGIGIYTPSFPTNLKLQFKTAGQAGRQIHPHTESGKTGFRANSPGTMARRETLDVVFADHLDCITPEGKMSKTPQWHDDNLARLLQFQFLCATSNYQQDPAAAYKLLFYVCSMTAGILGLVEFNNQSSKLLSHISARSSMLAPYIPQVSLASSRELLDSRLAAATAFENNFYRFIQLGSDSGQLGSVVGLMASASDNANEIYAEMLQTSRTRYKNAQTANKEAIPKFAKANSGLDGASKRFKTGVQTWGRDQRNKASQDVIFAVVELTGAVAICFATGGATAPVVGASIVKAASAASRLGKIFAKIKAFYERFEPALTKTRGMVKTTKDTLKKLETVEDVKKLQATTLPANRKHDEVNGLAEWEIFIRQTEAMFEEIKDNEIDGKNEYKAALLELAILGRAVLLSETAVISTGENLAVMELKEKLAKIQRGTIDACLNTIDGDARIFEKLKLFMFDHLMAVRRSIYMDFSLYAMAYTYHSLSSNLPIFLSATKSAADYHSDVTKLHEAIVNCNAAMKVQWASFELTMADDPEAIKKVLSDGGTYSFALNHANAKFKDYYRIRVEEVSCYLDGVTASGNGTVELLLKTGHKFEDKNISHEACPFSGKPQEWVFGYKVDTKVATSNRSLHGVDGAIKFPPFTDWAVKVHGGRNELDFSNFTGISLHFRCEVVLGSKLVK